MSIVTSTGNAQAPTQLPGQSFSDTTQEAFREYLRIKSNRYRFTDEKYDLYRHFLLQPSLGELSLSHLECDKEHIQKDKEGRAKILALRDFCLDDDNRLCRKAETGPPLIVLRDWQLYGVITTTHCQIPHGGQEKTFTWLSKQYYGVIRPEVRWLLKHCKVCGL